MSASLIDLPFIDLYVRLDGAERALYRPKEQGMGHANLLVPESYAEAIASFAAAVNGMMGSNSEGSIDHNGLRCRLSRQDMGDNSAWVCARRLNSRAFELSQLGLAPHVYNHLHALGQRDGLIVVAGAAGQGKTTTAASLLADFLKSYGGLAVTIEDPIEYVMAGRHGETGHCFQMEAKTDDDWEACLKRALRWTPRYIYVGEIRTPRAAEQVLRAAATGHTVITTVHASSPEDTLMGILFLAEQAVGPGAVSLLAASLTALAHQTMKDSGPFLRYIFTEENAPGDPIRSLIREGKIGMMSTYIDRIAARLANQQPAPQTSPLPPLPPLGNGTPAPTTMSANASPGQLPPLPPIPPRKP